MQFDNHKHNRFYLHEILQPPILLLFSVFQEQIPYNLSFG